MGLSGEVMARAKLQKGGDTDRGAFAFLWHGGLSFASGLTNRYAQEGMPANPGRNL